MGQVALDDTKLLVLMAAGGLFAVAGLWLMFRPKPEGGAAKLELLGMKFESSSAGLLVFLIGAGFLATPLIVEKQVSSSGPAAPGAPDAGATDVGRQPADTPPAVGPKPPGPSTDVPRRVRATGKEREPNDGYDDANQIAVGDSVAGRVTKESEDWYAMPVDPAKNSVLFKVRNLQGTPACSAIRFYSGDEAQLGDPIGVPEVNTVSRYELDTRGAQAVFVRITACSYSTSGVDYELFTSYEPID